MAGEGFKIADAFVEVTARLDDSEVARAARTAGERASRELTDSMGRAGKSSSDNFGRSFSGGGSSKIGAGLAGSLLSGVVGTAGKIGSSLTDTLASVGGKGGPMVGAAVLTGVAVAGPMIGAALGGALTAGVVGAGIGLGIAASIRQPAVKAAIGDLKADATRSFNAIGKDWEPTMLSVIGNIRGDIPGIGSALQSALAPAKGYVQPLVDGLTSLVRNVLPGFGSLIANAGPVVGAVRDSFAEIGQALGDAFDTVSGSTGGMAAGMQTVAYIVADLIRMGGSVIAWLADAYTYTVDWAVTLLGFLSQLPGVGDTFKGWQEDMMIIQETAHSTGPALDAAGKSMTGLEGATSKASATSESMAMRQRILNGTFAEGADEAGDLKAAMDALNGAAMSAEEAEIGYRESIKAATDALKANGKETGLNTEKGRANRTALLDLAKAGQDRAKAQYDQTAATKGTSAAEKAAATAYNNSRNQLIKVAQQMGMTRGEAVAYANKVMAIPKSWTTKIKADTKSASNSIASVRKMLRNIPDETVNIAMRVTGNKSASASAAAIRKQYGMSKGGPVIGPGQKGVDSVFRVLAPGEHVWTAAEVEAAGGHRMMQAWRSMVSKSGGDLAANAKKKTLPSAPPRPSTTPRTKDPVATRPIGNMPVVGNPNHGKIGIPKPVPGSGIPAGPSGPPVHIPDSDGGSSGGGDTHIYHIGNITLDPAGIRSIQELAELVEGVGRTARTHRARSASPAGA